MKGVFLLAAVVVVAGCDDTVCPAPPGGISGVACDEDGSGTAATDVRAHGIDTEDSVVGATDDEGFFSLSGLSPGSWDLVVHTSDGATRPLNDDPVEVLPTETTVVVDVRCSDDA